MNQFLTCWRHYWQIWRLKRPNYDGLKVKKFNLVTLIFKCLNYDIYQILSPQKPSCCFCMTKPGGLMLMRFHYFLSAGTVILGIVCGVESDLKDGYGLKKSFFCIRYSLGTLISRFGVIKMIYDGHNKAPFFHIN